MTRPFISVTDLHIETDSNGFILGQSVLGDTLTDEANVWREVKSDFSNLTLTRSVSVEKGVLFRPEAATLNLRTPTTVYMSGAFGRKVRVRWKDSVLFVGEIKSATLSSAAEHDGDKTYMNLTAVGLVERLNNYVLYNLSRPAETAGQRVLGIVPAGVTAIVNNCNRPMADRGPSNVKLTTVLQEATDAQIARVYVDRTNALVVDGEAAPEPAVFFSDDASVGTHIDYRNVSMAESLNNTITQVVVEAKQDETLTAIATHPSAVVRHEESYQVDLPLEQNEINAWAQSFPLLGYTRLEPAAIDTYWQDGLADLELTHLVRILWKGREFRAGVRGISYSIRPTHEHGLAWDVEIELMPGHLLEFTPVLAPSQPQAFTATATDDHTIELTWQRPALPNQLDGYELRVAEGSVPPETRDDGELVTTLDGLSYTHTGRASNVRYSYSLWATTPNPVITSKKVTASVTTPETIPSAVQSLSAARNSATQHTLTWTAPAAPGDDVVSYEIRFRTDGVNPTASSGTLKATVDYGTTSYVATGLTRNATFRWGVFPKTALGAFGPGAFATQNTNETIPSAVKNLSVTAPAYNLIRVNLDYSDNATDVRGYRFEYNVNAGGPPLTPGSGTFWGEATNLDVAHDLSAQMNSWYDVSIWPVTIGGLYGPRASGAAKTPQGIFSHYWEGECSWSQSYKHDNAPSSLGSGSVNDLYFGYGDGFNGNQRSMAGWNMPANLVNCHAVDRVEVHIYNRHTWYSSGADCWFGVHGWTTRPGTFQQSAGGLAVYHMGKGVWLGVDATAWLGPQLRAGAKGITLGPAPNTSNSYYGYAAGTPGPRPVIKVWYRTIGG